MDVYPTLCELTGIEPPSYIHGESLTPVMKNPSIQLKDEIYTRYKEGEAVVDQNYSYTEFFRGETYLGNMLYDLKKNIPCKNLRFQQNFPQGSRPPPPSC